MDDKIYNFSKIYENADAMMKQAEQAGTMAKIAKKQAEIAKTKDSLANKQNQLNKINSKT